MGTKKLYIIGIIITTLFILSSCTKAYIQNEAGDSLDKSSSHIYLYGEKHGEKKILDKEFEIWNTYYHEKEMRHLFVELPHYTAQYLNIWMKSDNDGILEQLYIDWSNTAIHKTCTLEFYKEIKSKCPNTIFHGTDVGHQGRTTGKRYLEYLEKNKLENTEEYILTKEIIKQGEEYYLKGDDIYRENKMVENFIREFDKLDKKYIMGIYGAAHTGLDSNDYTNSIPCMANQLQKHYGQIIKSVDLSEYSKEIDPIREDIIRVEDKDYKGLYFGEQNLSNFKEYKYRQFWRLENAYEDFKDNIKTKDMLPYNNYPMKISENQVFIIDYTKVDGTIIRKYYRSDGNFFNGLPSTEEFAIK